MRGTVAKKIRRKVYGDLSYKVRRYATHKASGAAVRVDLGSTYRKYKRLYMKGEVTL